MKKSLVISTIATVLVVVVALTTATFAWFTAGSVSQATAEFTISTAGGAIQITPWDKTQNNYAAAPYSGGDAMPLGGYDQSYEFSLAASNGATENESTNALNGYKPLVPKEELTDAVTDASVVGEQGLPGINFINAQQQGSQINVINTDARPVVARFRLDTIKDTVNAQIRVTLAVPADAPTTSYTAANNFKFVLFGVSAAPGENAQSFTFGTNYSYVTKQDDTEISTTGTVAPKYQDVTFTETLTGSAIEDAAEFETINSGNRTRTVTLDFKMTAGVAVECYLYVWLDGRYATNTSSDGEVNFTLNFVDLDASGQGGGQGG